MELETNVLYYGDNLKILRDHIPDESINLVYLDPPFNSKATYNVLFKEPGGASSQAQISAFEDTWHWGLESERALQEIAASPIAPAGVKEFMSVLPKLVGRRTDMAAYLTMMCVRLIELRRVLKSTGSLYLHCDPTASHYLKLMLDTIFGPQNFRNEIVWQRTSAGKPIYKNLPKNSDIIFWFTKGEDYYWQPILQSLTEEDISTFNLDDNDGRGKYNTQPIINPGYRPNLRYVYADLKGRQWAPPSNGWRFNKERMRELEKDNRLIFKNTIREKYYLSERLSKGKQLSNIWTDIVIVSGQERLGYPTQKPEALLERIIQASSNEGDVVLDPFCGCGTAVVAAQKFNRKWIGIDITHLAIGLMKWRLKNLAPPAKFTVRGEPVDLAGAQALAEQDKYQFQWWAVSLVGGQPYGDKKKGADTGIDGYLYYMDEKDKIKKAIISVKGGKSPTVSMVRDLGHVIDREKADIGIFITLEKPTQPMLTEAAQKGFYHSPLGKDYPRLQVLTVEEILSGKMPDIPPWIAPVPTPPKSTPKSSKQPKML